MATYPVSSQQIMNRAKQLNLGFLYPRPAVNWRAEEQTTSSITLSLFHNSTIPVDHQVSIASKVSLLLSVKKPHDLNERNGECLYEDKEVQHTLLLVTDAHSKSWPLVYRQK